MPYISLFISFSPMGAIEFVCGLLFLSGLIAKQLDFCYFLRLFLLLVLLSLYCDGPGFDCFIGKAQRLMTTRKQTAIQGICAVLLLPPVLCVLLRLRVPGS